MFFYKMEADIIDFDECMEKSDFAYEIQMKQSLWLIQAPKNLYIYLSLIKKGRLTLGMIVGTQNADESVVENYADEYLNYMQISHENNVFCEVTMDVTKKMLRKSESNDFIATDDEVMEYMGTLEIMTTGHLGRVIKEGLISVDGENEGNLFTKVAKRTLREELKRIDADKADGMVTGHPVQYIVNMEVKNVAEEVNRLLLGALYNKHRLTGRRYTIINPDERYLNAWEPEDVYKLSKGCAVIIECRKDMRENDAYADSKREMIERICALAEEYSDSVLTIFDITKRCVEVKKCVYSTTRDISFVEISEDVMFGKEAREYVVDIAKNEGIDIVKEVNEFIDDDEKSYRAEELNRFVNKCKREILRTEIYPQYANIKTSTQTMVNETPRGSAYEELMEMIGLSGAKEVINNAIKYYKAQALFEKRGIRKSNSAMHMIFTGNPGTAKTSVARLIAQIMKDNGVLSVGSLYELGRADLVGKYVGWTAQIVKKRFEKARGSVLFIDEAYSLVDGTHSFGDEAINTIVQEMENNRSDMIVIFAGYPNEMERFMKKNPGLRSRIAYHINFDDYNAEELYSIAELMAKKDNIHLDSDVKEKLMPIFEAERNSSDFGNGRFVRNLLEQARMKQAARIMESNPENMSDAEIATLMAKDFEFKTVGKVSDLKRIGFV